MVSLIKRMKIILIDLASLLPAAAYSIGGAGDTAWPSKCQSSLLKQNEDPGRKCAKSED